MLVNHRFRAAINVAATVVVLSGTALAIAPDGHAATTSSSLSRGQSIGYGGTFDHLNVSMPLGAVVRLDALGSGTAAATVDGLRYWGSGTTSSLGHVHLDLTRSGDVVLFGGTKVIRDWHFTTAYRLTLQQDGRVVIRDSSSRTLWASGLHGVEAALAHDVVTKINQDRAQLDRHPVYAQSHLDSSGDAHTTVMGRYGVLAHQVKVGSYVEPTFSARLIRAGYHYSTAGENIGVSNDGTRQGVEHLQAMMWQEGPGGAHYDNIANSGFVNVGVGVRFDLDHGRVWLTEDFGHPS